MDDFALALDTETTALMKNRAMRLDKQPEIFEFYSALFNMNTGEIVDEYSTMIRTTKTLPDEVVKITGVMDKDLTGAPPFSAVAAEIKRRIEVAPLIIAHNASYDQEVIDIEFERLGQKVEWGPLLCTVECTVHLYGFRLSLSALHEHLFGAPFAGAHRASEDTKALIRCVVELRKRREV